MNTKTLSLEIITDFETHLYKEEKSTATVVKYTRDARAFCVFCRERSVTKELVESIQPDAIIAASTATCLRPTPSTAN